jgi:organic hydroperoxide reductase OsmC/OhrA
MAFKNLRRSVRDFREEKKTLGHSWPEHLLLSSIAWCFTSQYGREQRMSQYFYGC